MSSGLTSVLTGMQERWPKNKTSTCCISSLRPDANRQTKKQKLDVKVAAKVQSVYDTAWHKSRMILRYNANPFVGPGRNRESDT